MNILVTGAAGFIGSTLALRLLERGDSVVGLDNLNDYYDVSLKEARLARLRAFIGFEFEKADIAERGRMARLFAERRFDAVMHLAAQAGVRAGKVLNAPSGAGAGAARSYLADVAGSLVVGPSLSEGRTAATVTVRCSGQAQNVIPLPGFEISVTQSANAGIERFTTR